ncbi:alpha-amylase family glycosyl hydrolase [Actinomadura viridis]|uniref:alpha-amylase family glycosyl hydrolase n=1 Tax=Actinomadura viridis TaxID=58110 RepID=UPI003678A7DF
MPDLKTSDPAVRSKLAGFLNSQIALGVDGFRIDAAKHMPNSDLEAIFGRLTCEVGAARTFTTPLNGQLTRTDTFYGDDPPVRASPDGSP